MDRLIHVTFNHLRLLDYIFLIMPHVLDQYKVLRQIFNIQ